MKFTWSPVYFNNAKLVCVACGLVGTILAIIDAGIQRNYLYLSSTIFTLLGYLVVLEGIWNLISQPPSFHALFTNVFIPKGDREPRKYTKVSDDHKTDPAVVNPLHELTPVGNPMHNKDIEAGVASFAAKQMGKAYLPSTLTKAGKIHFQSTLFEGGKLEEEFESYVGAVLPISFNKGVYEKSGLTFVPGYSKPSAHQLCEVAYDFNPRSLISSFASVDLEKQVSNNYGPRVLKFDCYWIDTLDRKDESDYFCSKVDGNNKFAVLTMDFKYHSTKYD